jgi:hypothetical protein
MPFQCTTLTYKFYYRFSISNLIYIFLSGVKLLCACRRKDRHSKANTHDVKSKDLKLTQLFGYLICGIALSTSNN